MEYFVDTGSVVRKIWGQGDTILFIFAGGAAEFALNKAVDWLYFTGKLPKDPLGRLFSTVSYARSIVFAEKQAALNAIDKISAIHSTVEGQRGMNIPDWAYRDVLFMLIDYSIISFELLERKLDPSEKQEVFNVFFRVGKRMNLKDLPETYESFKKMRKLHLEQHLLFSEYTAHLYKQYRKHLGLFRYRLLLETQMLITPRKVRNFLGFRSFSLLSPMIPVYKLSKNIRLDWLLKSLLLPSGYKEEILALDHKTTW